MGDDFCWDFNTHGWYISSIYEDQPTTEKQEAGCNIFCSDCETQDTCTIRKGEI